MLGAWLVAALVVPELHRHHHARFGDDHVHGEFGTIYFGPNDANGTDENFDEAHHHAAFDADLAALGLDEVAFAGTQSIDCALATYTLAACPDGQGESGHPHTFGDALLAHAPHRHAPDPTHGRGALEHGGASLLASAPFLLAPPFVPVEKLPFAPAPRAHAAAAEIAHAGRGPPALV